MVKISTVNLSTFQQTDFRTPAVNTRCLWSTQDVQRAELRDLHSTPESKLQKRADSARAPDLKSALTTLPTQACGTSSHYHPRGHKFPIPTVRPSRALKAFLPRSIILWYYLHPDIQAQRTVASYEAAL